MTKNKALVICYNVVKGGGVPIVIDFVNYCVANDIDLVVLCPDTIGYSTLKNLNNQKKAKIKIIFFKGRLNSLLLKPLINYLFLPIFSACFKSHKICNFGNVAFPSLQKQFLLMHNAFVVCEDPNLYRDFSLKEKLVQKAMIFFIRLNLRFADVIGVQTNIIHDAMLKNLGKNSIIIPNIPAEIPGYENCFRLNPLLQDVKLLFLSKYYAHKNFSILISLAALFDKNNKKYKITLTISDTEQGVKAFVKKIKSNGLCHYFDVIGNVSASDLEQLYHEHDGMLLPTLLESFSGTYLESMVFGKPIFTSDRDFAKSVCGNGAFYFDPLVASSIYEVLEAAFKKPKEIANIVEANQKRVRQFQTSTENINRQIWIALTNHGA